ncbi:MAG TPA: septum site-determining protein MinC [Desulfotomaculum sp.]|nr:septum site-determining protein MinC [Desulfotomaculum sp.]
MATDPGQVRADPRVRGAEENQTVLIQRTLRSGQSIFYPGNVVVLGDVNPGAQVAATGDVIVVGALRGTVHAGAGGDEAAVVIAFRLEPTQLRIAEHVSRPPAGMVPAGQPEVARVRDGVISIGAFSGAGERQGTVARALVPYDLEAESDSEK